MAVRPNSRSNPKEAKNRGGSTSEARTSRIGRYERYWQEATRSLGRLHWSKQRSLHRGRQSNNFGQDIAEKIRDPQVAAGIDRHCNAPIQGGILSPPRGWRQDLTGRGRGRTSQFRN